MDKRYVENLENVIKQMLTPLKNIPFNLVIESLSGCKIIPFDPSDPKDKGLLEDLRELANIAGTRINSKGIRSKRPNEVGNYIESYVMDALFSIGYKANVPQTASGKLNLSGYPDIEFSDKSNNIHYLECKTYNIKNIASTQRSFYVSPSDDFKVTKPAHHFVISFEVFLEKREGNIGIFKVRKWKILALDKLLVDVKYEFNSDNLRLYSKEHILAQGEYR